MRLSRASLCALVVVAGVAAPATAGDSCPTTFTDRRGDTTPQGLPVPEHVLASHDITGGGIVFGKKTVVGTLRLATTDAAAGPATLAGSAWRLRFSRGGIGYEFWREIAPGTRAESYKFVDQSDNDKVLRPVVRRNGTTITWTVPRSAVSSGRESCDLNAWTFVSQRPIDTGYVGCTAKC